MDTVVWGPIGPLLEGLAQKRKLPTTLSTSRVRSCQALLAYLESGRLAGTGSPVGSSGGQKNIFARLTFGLITKKSDSDGPSEADVARWVMVCSNKALLSPSSSVVAS